ncbi:MAG: hypothetical protein AAFX99_24875, partial [Myxococcota bacterium]
MPHTPSTFKALSAGLVLGAVGATAVGVLADGDPTTDTVPRALPYEGIVELDGQPINASGENALWIEFALYDAADLTTPVYTQRNPVDVYMGRFTTTIGPNGEHGTSIASVVQAADNLMLGMTLLGDPDDDADDTRLSNLQQLHATAFSLWTTSATDLSVASDMTVGSNAMVGSNLTVGAHVTVGGDVTLQGGQLDSTTGVVGLGGNTVVTGSDFVLGTDDGRTTGLRTQQRALVHDIDDTLTLNYRGDFEGGTQINSDTQITGNLTVNGTAQINGGTLKPEYHVTSTTYLNTIDLDMDRIEELCGDRGGCTVR